ncbi:MAG: 23S rRNA (adenine(2503)-C(2))-methyltransferase RlmN [Planctomycetota bacterium]
MHAAQPPRALTDFTAEELRALMAAERQPTYRTNQVFSWVQKQGARTYDEMSNVPKALREALAAKAPVRTTTVAHEEPSADGTTKLLLRLHDGEHVECVLIPEGERATACLSTQVGCGVGCVFCASGAEGVVRNLSAGEIVEQALELNRMAGQRLTNIVVMGMGEPLHNLDALERALRILQDPEGLDFGARRITVSTSGPVKAFEDFLTRGLKVKLAISLHAAFDGLRKELVPRGGTGDIHFLESMSRRWFEKTGRDVTFEYVLLDNINDSDEDMRALAKLAGRHVNVNLIPMNPVPFAPKLKAPPNARIERCVSLLEEEGVVVHCRRQRGDDVAAACGQLRRFHEKLEDGQETAP